MRSLARRSLALYEEAKVHETSLRRIVAAWHPELLDQQGVGPIVAATVLCAWSHSGRFASEAGFAALAGVAPIEASSGMTVRHRPSRSGDRQLNRAFHVVVMTRLRYDERTIAYAKRRSSEGKSDREIKRCLKRYVARSLFRLLESAPIETG